GRPPPRLWNAGADDAATHGGRGHYPRSVRVSRLARGTPTTAWIAVAKRSEGRGDPRCASPFGDGGGNGRPSSLPPRRNPLARNRTGRAVPIPAASVHAPELPQGGAANPAPLPRLRVHQRH